MIRYHIDYKGKLSTNVIKDVSFEFYDKKTRRYNAVRTAENIYFLDEESVVEYCEAFFRNEEDKKKFKHGFKIPSYMRCNFGIQYFELDPFEDSNEECIVIDFQTKERKVI